MKRILVSLLALCLVLSLCFSLTSCGWFDEEETTTIEILETPEATDFLALLNNGIADILASKPEITYNSSVKVGGVEAKHPEGSASDYDLGTFDSAADYVKNLILNEKPFDSNSVTVERGTAITNGTAVGEKTFDETDIYLTEISAADFAKITDSEENARNWASENATDDEGNTITNSEGDVETVSYLADNNLIIGITFNEVNETLDDEGNVTESTAIAPQAAIIEKYFGSPANAAAITTELNKTADYLQFGDYTYEYADCSLSAVIDLTTGKISSITFNKTMNITLPVVGVGTFEAIGDAILVMKSTESSSFSFNYDSADDSQTETTAAPSETASVEPTIAETTAATEETTAATEETTAATEETAGETLAETAPETTAEATAA